MGVKKDIFEFSLRGVGVKLSARGQQALYMSQQQLKGLFSTFDLHNFALAAWPAFRGYASVLCEELSIEHQNRRTDIRPTAIASAYSVRVARKGSKETLGIPTC
jgi:hypothetical protein